MGKFYYIEVLSHPALDGNPLAIDRCKSENGAFGICEVVVKVDNFD